MELPQIGKQCAAQGCKQLDFLPLHCSCGQVFCSEHFPIHIESCKISNQLTENELKKIVEVYICSHAGCNERSVVALLCNKCGKHFCVQHRHILQCGEPDLEALAVEKERYAAPVRLFNEAKAEVDKQVDNNLNEAKKKSKNQEMAIKVQLMRIKNKATGQKGIPPTDRVYFNIFYQKDATETPVFVSNTWSIGRVIDAVAQECKLRNNNNKVNENKLRLFKKEDGRIISKDMSVPISNLINEKVIVNGESLVIEYVTNDCEVL